MQDLNNYELFVNYCSECMKMSSTAEDLKMAAIVRHPLHWQTKLDKDSQTVDIQAEMDLLSLANAYMDREVGRFQEIHKEEPIAVSSAYERGITEGIRLATINKKKTLDEFLRNMDDSLEDATIRGNKTMRVREVELLRATKILVLELFNEAA